MKVAFVFPGQGSQYVGMGLKMSEAYSAAREIFRQADETLGFPLSRLCFEGPAEELQKTVNAQPAILTVSVACLQVLREKGVQPAVVAGHSLGEYSALVAAGALGFTEALLLVRKRGQYMQEAVPLGEGGMVAVLGLEARTLSEICREVTEKGCFCAVANYNSPGQVVIAGETKALAAASALAREAGAKKCVPLSVSAPFHTPLMRPAAQRLAADLAQTVISDPRVPVVANVTADYVKTGEEVRNLLVAQIDHPVCWEQSVQRIVSDGAGIFLEIGPGSVLTGLIKKISRLVFAVNVEDPESLEQVLARLGEVS
ncbi:MAG: ACP S-malonyltransferase [Moorella sp. (in: Bacteria)]|nr:ACP S-malonyltransferase [Moorella sp. (in: firmicutes)]